jgi:hypothetical protein
MKGIFLSSVSAKKGAIEYLGQGSTEEIKHLCPVEHPAEHWRSGKLFYQGNKKQAASSQEDHSSSTLPVVSRETVESKNFRKN